MSTCLDDLNVTLAEIRDAILSQNGWQGFSPTMSQGVSVSIDTYVSVWRLVSGSNYQANIIVTATSGGTSGEVIRLGNLPFNPGTIGLSAGLGYGGVFDISLSRMLVGLVFPSGTNEISVWSNQPDSIIGTSPAFALASGDVLSFHIDTWIF